MTMSGSRRFLALGRRLLVLAIFALFSGFVSAATYYVSSSAGNDNNNGTSDQTPFASITRVNQLSLAPGDRVLFRCGDTFRGPALVLTDSGASGNPITIGSYPDTGCADQPLLSGAFPVSGWSVFSGNIYVADLNSGGNSGLFPNGLNQLFEGDARLPFGRWPNRDAGDGGFSTVDQAPSGTQITDNQLPTNVNWTGAIAHIKAIRWSITNREVVGHSGTTLQLGTATDCYQGCQDWGYWLSNHLATLDSEGEWYYDASANRVYLYSAGGSPQGIEGSAVMESQGGSIDWGLVVLGDHLRGSLSYVTVDNLHVTRSFEHGITTPTNSETQEPQGLILRNNTVSDCDGIGLNLAVWAWNLGGNSGWRGGTNLTVENNTITRINHMGINLYSRDSLFRGNHVSDIALIDNLGASGMGCGLTGSQGFCTEFGDGVRIKLDNPTFTAFGNTFEHNRIERTGYCGIDIFGRENIIRENLFLETCYSKGDCGAVRTFGQSPIQSSPVADLEIRNNVILDTLGNTDGCRAFFDPPFGIGLYIDFFSRNVLVDGNTVAGSTIDGVLFQNSSGSVSNNTLFNNNTGTMERGQLYLEHGPTQLTQVVDNIFYGQNERARTISTDSFSRVLASDRNAFFNPYNDRHILGEFATRTFQDWRNQTGFDSNSITNDFNLSPGDEPLGTLFVNGGNQAESVDLEGVIYRNLQGEPVTGSLQLAPYSSIVLIDTGESAPGAVLSGDTTICAAESALLTVDLEGVGPWSLVWSDGASEQNINATPHARTVNPSQTTTYTLTSVSDSRGAGGVSGSATVIVGTADPLSISPLWLAAGVLPPRFTAAIPCSADVSGLTWQYNGQTVATDTNPFDMMDNQAGAGTLTIGVTTTNMGTLNAEAFLLVAPTPWRDRNGDGCNTSADLHLAASQWGSDLSGDPSGNGRVDVLDLLYINTSGDCNTPRKSDTVFIRTASR